MKKILSALLVFLLALGLFACNDENTTAQNTTPEPIDYITPTVLEVQLIPSRDATVLEAQRAPLQALLEAELGMEEYVADVVIELNYRIEYGKIVRYMRILKARGRPIPLSELYLNLTPFSCILL